LVIAAVLTGLHRSTVPLLIALIGVLTAFGVTGGHPSRSISGNPLIYSNASGSFYLLAFVAALMLFAQARGFAARAVTVVLAAVLAFATLLAASWAASVLLVLPLAPLMLRIRLKARIWLAVMAGLFALALAASVTLGATFEHGELSPTVKRVVDQALSQRRPALWHDALWLIRDHPLWGVGPGRFAAESPIALSDSDARWAHNGFLQQGAETGLIGFGLLVLLFAWGFFRLWKSPSPDTVTALAGTALAALAIHACIDYVLHFPSLPLMAAALVSAGVGRSARTSRASGDESKIEHELART
jgi:O-antigen ligase